MATSEVNAGTMKEVLAGMLPLIKEFALTPEKLREAMKPYQDPALIAREKRERERNRRQFLEGLERTKAIQKACPHKDKNEKWALSLTHNFPDRMPRGVCPLCQAVIYPAHWEIAAPDDEHPDGRPFIIPEHELYHVVRFLESTA
jgi:hypothetical protein